MKLIFIKDSLGKEYSGEFNSVQEAFEFYRQELDDNDIIISRAYIELPELKKFSEWFFDDYAYWDYHYETDVTEYGYDEDGTYRGAVGEELIIDNLPIVFENENYQDLFEMEIKNLLRRDDE